MGCQEEVDKLGYRTNQNIQKSNLNLETLTGHPINLDKCYKTTTIGIREHLGTETLGKEYRIDIPLEDDEYQKILAKHISTSNRYSMNMLAACYPEICKTIMLEVLRSCNLLVNMSNPFIIEFIEHKAICESILSSSDVVLEGNEKVLYEDNT